MTLVDISRHRRALPTGLASGAPSTVDVLAALRAEVRAIEGHAPTLETPPPEGAAWGLGLDAVDLADLDPPEPVDRRENWKGENWQWLDGAGVHEIKPVPAGRGGTSSAVVAAATTTAVATGFALRLAVRRLQALGQGPPVDGISRDVVWCRSAVTAGEIGRLHGPGLVALGFDPARVLEVEAVRAGEAAWAIEEALRSRAAALVVGQVAALDLTAARRLALAAAAGRTPCLLMTAGQGPETAGTASRWRVCPAPRGEAAHDPRRSGAFRVAVRVERQCRGQAPVRDRTVVVEWCDDAYRFRSPAVVADRAAALGRKAG